MKKSDLDDFTGSSEWFRHPFGRLFFTEGVKYLADNAHAYWLIDAIASYQSDPVIVNDPMLREMQFWKLTVKDGSAVLTCVKDDGEPPSITQKIEFTDFPLDEVDIWVESGAVPYGSKITEGMVAMLPSER